MIVLTIKEQSQVLEVATVKSNNESSFLLMIRFHQADKHLKKSHIPTYSMSRQMENVTIYTKKPRIQHPESMKEIEENSSFSIFPRSAKIF